MSARVQVEPLRWEELEPILAEFAHKEWSEVEVEKLFQNVDQNNLVAPLREMRGSESRGPQTQAVVEEKRRAALALQEQWDAWFAERERLRCELKRGKELWEETQKEVAAERARLEEWATYERVCGKNPLADYMHNLFVHERIEQFLPGWLKRREERLEALTQKMERCARDNGLEHLL